MSAKENDINDIFCSIACSEEYVSRIGFAAGHKIGKDIGWQEGQHLGFHKGSEIGSQIGFYAGFVEQLLKVEKLKDTDKYSKVQPIAEKLKELTENFPNTNDSTVDTLNLLEECKTAYKKLCAVLKMKIELPETRFLSY